MRDPQGRIWVGTNRGLEIYEGGERASQSFASGESIPNNDIRALALDGQGRVWAGTALGAARIALDAPESEHWSLRHSLRWLPSNDVRDLHVGDDATYIATAAGLAVLRSKTMTLAEKAAHYEAMVRARHFRAPGLMEKCYLRTPGDLSSWAEMDTDNDGGFTAAYLGSQSYRYAATRDPEAKVMADRLFDGLEFLQTVTETPGFIARTVIPADWTRMADANRTYTEVEIADERVRDPRFRRVENRWRLSRDGKWRWKGDTSSDEVTAHFFGYALYYDLAADEPHRKRVRALVRRVMDYIVEGGYVLRDIDGQPTLWGVWSPEKLNGDPNWQPERGVNSVEILSYLVTTAHITGDKKYLEQAAELCGKHGYDRNARHPKLASPGQFTFIDDELLSFAYRGLFGYGEQFDCLAGCRAGLDQWFGSIEQVNSPLYTFVYQLASGGPAPAGVEGSVEFLRQMPLDLVMWSVDNSSRRDLRIVQSPVADNAQTDRLLPPGERGVVGWDGNPYKAHEHGFGGHAEASPTFWLVPYWLGRQAGYVAGP
ncbi:MAG: two-component regulator propeller domain-containing protein, partial [Pirellulales bacterium]